MEGGGKGLDQTTIASEAPVKFQMPLEKPGRTDASNECQWSSSLSPTQFSCRPASALHYDYLNVMTPPHGMTEMSLTHQLLSAKVRNNRWTKSSINISSYRATTRSYKYRIDCHRNVIAALTQAEVKPAKFGSEGHSTSFLVIQDYKNDDE